VSGDVLLPNFSEDCHRHKVRCGRRIIKNSRNEAGMSMKTKGDVIQDAGLAETTGIPRPQRTGSQVDRSQRECLEPKWRQARHGHKVRCGSRSIENSRNEAGMSLKTKDEGIQDAGLAGSTGILRPQRTGPQNDSSIKPSASNPIVASSAPSQSPLWPTKS